ncbi:hypothetical protein [Thermoflavimicrobium dichotomicum]|uniref:Uncharacterized protein n=1 Tax=Thermoflavimicrobium dichotomicum TaxID=46223 RepID=A0A1I3MJ89_9BACL|nr:hypothetical protein [Thermoflavimicrobium dichotomicum]SFI96746.1 hypothetical protein SAMN05421852_10381 [Thermoflavimicrobium dichotomicum]
MRTVKLSNLILAVSPELYDLLTEAELNSYVLVERDFSELDQEELNDIIAKAIVFHQVNPRYH